MAARLAVDEGRSGIPACQGCAVDQNPAAPATPPAQPGPPPQPPAPFPQGAKIAYVNPVGVFQASPEGKASAARIQALIAKKQKEAEDKAKPLQANHQKLHTTGGPLNHP